MSLSRERINVARSTEAVFDAHKARADFPILDQEVNGRPLAYLDNAATSQKPRAVIEAVARYYGEDNANVHRGLHALSERATQAYEGARDRVQRFLNAASRKEVVFARGTTEAINLVAQAYARPRLGPGDEIVISEMEHHSNIVPWQMVCKQTGASLRVAPIADDGSLVVDECVRLLGPRTRLLALVHVSNSLGTVNPVEPLIEAAHERGIPVLLDGAQAVPHRRVDVRALGCDFYAFSGHKVYGPTGVGVLYAREALLEEMEPWQGGGDMIRMVSFEGTTWNDLPYKFEAGTPNIAGVVGLGAALDYLEGHGVEAIDAHERELLAAATEAIGAIPGVRLIGTAPEKTAILAFVLESVHAHDVGTVLDSEGVAIRAGHHCTMPLMARFGVAATARASFALYNTFEDIEGLVRGIEKAKALFAR